MPRSPNKRTLPPTKEPGLWAADGAPRASDDVPRLFNVEIPIPLVGATETDRFVANQCAKSMTEATRIKPSPEGYILALPENVRRCLAGMLLRFCAGEIWLGVKDGAITHPSLPKEAVRATTKQALDIEQAFCSGVKLDNIQLLAFNSVSNRWKRQPRIK